MANEEPVTRRLSTDLSHSSLSPPNSRRSSHGWFNFGRRRSSEDYGKRNSISISSPEPIAEDADAVVKALKIHTVLVSPTQTTITLKANFSDKTKKLVLQAIKRVGAGR